MCVLCTDTIQVPVMVMVVMRRGEGGGGEEGDLGDEEGGEGLETEDLVSIKLPCLVYSPTLKLKG